ncbi:hypothetical protein FHS83_003095 [Rhizomicrobium palustre]|uniref:NTF2 fold domain-containing protein n=1 Tax=Rhizomicrobium palustre TaxID=189966 RepID=A0A846N3U9_9PROT|nr:YbbC/YhhH family protein [Rhizomicrobium palustre]NIK89777.1 hypothetical protein [Rhizomicrobium palustre]
MNLSHREPSLFSKTAWAVVFALLFSSVAIAEHSYTPPQGFVPDERTAISVAEAILTPIYGSNKIRSERPFKAMLKGDVWVVSGSLPRGWGGGVAVIELRKDDGRVLRVSHGK